MSLLREYIRKILLTEKVYGPVYRATHSPGPEHKHVNDPKTKLPKGGAVLYWAEDPRTAEFGKHVTKAKIRLNDPYMGLNTQI